ncbi:MAG: hypothetical protein M3447_08825 [Acidobacteriota bacterium]|nr:hypothetical protein [Acidobacteriota bacterium]
MNCQSFENVVIDLAREQMIAAAVREEALQHSDACFACATRLGEERSLSMDLRALVVEMNSLGAPEQVKSRLLAAFSAQPLVPQVRSKRWNYLGLAAAAILLMAFAIGVAAWNLRAPFRFPSSNVVASKPVANTPSNVVSSSPELPPVAIKEPVTNSNSKVRGRAGKPRRSNLRPDSSQSVAALSETEIATDFMPIGYVNSASLQDSGSIVRVELPRSTIVSMGFAVNMDRYGERVKADVLMGADGLARAIRFVQ